VNKAGASPAIPTDPQVARKLLARFTSRGTTQQSQWNTLGPSYSQEEEEERMVKKYFLSSVRSEQLRAQ
jgi:hypothetical protein